MFTTSVGDYSISVQQGSLPAIYGDYKKHAKLCDEFALRPHEGELCFVSVSNGQHWPFLVVAQRFELAEAGFDPACLVAQDAHTLFIGAGRRVLGYRLDRPARLFEETTDAGFWEWARYGNTVVMSAELELAAWKTDGTKLWKMPLQPAWQFHVEKGQVHLDVLGRKSVFDLDAGPGHARPEK